MINPQSLDLASLHSVPLAEKGKGRSIGGLTIVGKSVLYTNETGDPCQIKRSKASTFQ